jgi:hypothetical protein
MAVLERDAPAKASEGAALEASPSPAREEAFDGAESDAVAGALAMDESPTLTAPKCSKVECRTTGAASSGTAVD